MFELVFLLNNLIDIVFAVQVSSQFLNLGFIFLNSKLLVLEFFLQFDDPLILFGSIISLIFLLFAFLLFFKNFIHFGCKLFQLRFQLKMLLNELGFSKQMGIFTQDYHSFVFNLCNCRKMIFNFQTQNRSHLIILSFISQQQRQMQQFLPAISQSLNQFVSQPLQLNQVTVDLLQKLSSIHNSHNKLLPSGIVEHFLEEVGRWQMLSNDGQTALEYILAMNCIRTILISNFHQLKQNQIYSAVSMSYAQALIELTESNTLGTSINAARISRGLLLSEIMIKLIQRAKRCFPEYFRFVKMSLEYIVDFLKAKKSIEKEIKPSLCKIPQSILCASIISLGFNQNQVSVKRWHMVFLANCLVHQLNKMINANSIKKNFQEMSIGQQIIFLGREIKDMFGDLFVFTLIRNQQEREEQNKVEEPIFLEQPLAFRQLTPRFYNQEESAIVRNLKKKKNKLTKKLHTNIRVTNYEKLQQQLAKDEVKQQRIHRIHKKELFVLQKQTEEAKKYQKQMGKVKMIKKKAGAPQKKARGAPGTKAGKKG